MNKRKRNSWNNFSWAMQLRNKLSLPQMPKIVAFDIESKNGLARLICNSNGDYQLVNDFESCIQFLTQRNIESTTNIFFNIRYDFNTIIKYLPELYFETLYKIGSVTYHGIHLSYIPKKFFKIIKGHHTWKFFDIAQFYTMSLNDASKKYLNEEKLEYNIKNLMQESYWQNDIENIILYCMQDCFLTKKLGDLIASKFIDIGCSFDNPYSIANLSAQWVSRNCHIPQSWKEEFQFYAFQAYNGGRFELFKKGYFENAYEIDINSAYPEQIVNLLDIDKGKWIKSKIVDENAAIGFLKCKISVSDKIIAPLPYQPEEQIIFPCLNHTEKFITLDEYNFINQYFPNSQIKVTDGWYFYPENEIYPFEPFKDIYKLKNKAKGIDESLYHMYKIILNSFYGKTIEIKEPYVQCSEPDKHDLDRLVQVDNPEEEGIYNKKYQCGKYFNPAFACLITSRTRLKLLKELIEHKENIIAAFTDSIFLEESPKNSVKIGTEMGEWENKGNGELLMVQTGVYTFKPKNKIITKFRGFNTTSKLDLFKWFSQHPNSQTLEKIVIRPQSMGETFMHEEVLKFEDFNAFMPFSKVLNINADTKRIWTRDAISCKDLLKNRIESKPKVIY